MIHHGSMVDYDSRELIVLKVIWYCFDQNGINPIELMNNSFSLNFTTEISHQLI